MNMYFVFQNMQSYNFYYISKYMVLLFKYLNNEFLIIIKRKCNAMHNILEQLNIYKNYNKYLF